MLVLLLLVVIKSCFERKGLCSASGCRRLLVRRQRLRYVLFGGDHLSVHAEAIQTRKFLTPIAQHAEHDEQRARGTQRGFAGIGGRAAEQPAEQRGEHGKRRDQVDPERRQESRRWRGR